MSQRQSQKVLDSRRCFLTVEATGGKGDDNQIVALCVIDGTGRIVMNDVFAPAEGTVWESSDWCLVDEDEVPWQADDA